MTDKIWVPNGVHYREFHCISIKLGCEVPRAQVYMLRLEQYHASAGSASNSAQLATSETGWVGEGIVEVVEVGEGKVGGEGDVERGRNYNVKYKPLISASMVHDGTIV